MTLATSLHIYTSPGNPNLFFFLPFLVTGLEERTVQGFDQSAPSYYVRLGSLSSRLRRRAYSRTLAKLQEAKQRSKGFIEELSVTVDLVGLHIWPPQQTHPSLEKTFTRFVACRLNTARGTSTVPIRWSVTN